MDSNLAAYAAQNREEQQENGGLLDALGKIALGAGALAAGALGARRLARGLTTSATSDLSSFSPKNVRRVAAEYLAPKEVVAPSRPAPTTAVQRQQQAIEFTRQARTERPQGIRQGNLQDMIKQVKVENLERLRGQVTELPASYYQRTPSTFAEFSKDPARALLTDPDLLKYVEAQELAIENLSPENRAEQSRQQAQVRRAYSAKADDVIAAIGKEQNTTQAAAQGDFALQYLKTAGYQDDVTMVDQHAGNLVTQIDHFANASNSAEDQVTGRVKAALSRNEDVNLGAVEIAEDQIDSQIARSAQGDPTVASVTELDAAINQVADSLPDGRPIDQAEAIATQPKYVFRERTFEKPGVRLQEQAAKVQRYQTPTPVSIVGGREARVGEMGRPGRFTVLPTGTTTEGIVFTGPSTPTLSADEIAAKLSEMQVSKETQIQNAMARGLSEARAKRNVQITESQRAALESSLPSYSSEDVLSRAQVKTYGDVSEVERFSEEAASRSGQLRALEEGGFLTEQQDPGAIRTEPQQVRRGVMIAPASKTSYRGVTGRPGEGLYGIIQPVPPQQLEVGMSETFGTGAVRASKDIKTELGETRGVTKPEKYFLKISPEGRETPEGFVYTGLAMSEPTRVSQRELVAEAMQQATASPEGDVPIPPSLRELTERQATPAARRSLGASQDIMRIMKFAPPEKAQQLVAEYIRKLQG